MNQGISVRICYCLITFLFLAGPTVNVYSQNRETPLHLFEKLVEGEWRLENSVQTFEWGLGKMSVVAKGYILNEGKKILASEGYWYWHPGKQRIEGVFTAINMPVVFFDYNTAIRGDSLISDIVAYDQNGKESKYVEIIYVGNDNSYSWSLMQNGTAIMEGTFKRQ
jgi:hypothetical protein